MNPRLAADKVSRYGRLLAHPRLLAARRGHILILSHMRARTTLLSHVLGSHPEICGYKELHCSYDGAVSFLRVNAALVRESNYGTANFLLDKLLHNRLAVEARLFKNRSFFPIFVLREPRGSLASMMVMHSEIKGSTYYDHLFKYYEERLAGLERLAAVFGDRALFLDSNALVQDTDEVLRKSAGFLGLRSPLSREYRLFSGTGTRGLGDPSEHIKAGVILSDTPSRARKPPPTEALQRAQRIYDQAYDRIAQACAQTITT